MRITGFSLRGVTALVFLLLARVSALAQDASSENAAEESFDIAEIRVLGNSVLDARTIESAVYEQMGTARTLKNVEAARDALANAYRERGFGAVFVDIPEQDVADGIVRLRVSEGRLDRVRVTGAKYFANGKIRAAMPSLAKGEVVDFKALQADLALVGRQSRDRSVTPILKAGRAPGLVDLELRVEDQLPLHGSVEVNDRYTADTSRTRVVGALSFDNLWQKFHSLSLQYQTAPEEPSEVGVVAATYVMPVGTSGRALAMYAVDTDSDVATIGGLSVLGTGRIFGARFIQPLPARGENYFQSINVGVDYKDFEESIALPDAIDRTPISYLVWSLQYGASYRADTRKAAFALGPSFGIRRVINQSDEFAFKRAFGKPNFILLRANADFEQTLRRGWVIAARVAGQYAPEPLVSNEQFSIGGADSVRGYLEADELGDAGLFGSIELRTPMLLPKLAPHLSRLQALVFFDAGMTNIQEPLPQQVRRVDLSSVGLGLRIAGLDGFEAALDWAYALVPSDRVLDGDSRIHFQVRYGF